MKISKRNLHSPPLSSFSFPPRFFLSFCIVTFLPARFTEIDGVLAAEVLGAFQAVTKIMLLK